MKQACTIQWQYWSSSAPEFTAAYAYPEEFKNRAARPVKWFKTLAEAQKHAEELNQQGKQGSESLISEITES